MSNTTIENYLPRRLNDNQSFLERAAVCSALLMAHPELIKTPKGVFNELTVAASIAENDDEDVERTFVVTGCCFEFLGPLFELFQKSVTPADDDSSVSARDTQVHLDFFASAIKQMEEKPADDRFIEYKFEVTDFRARVQLQSNGIVLQISNLLWVAHQ